MLTVPFRVQITMSDSSRLT